MGRIAEIWDGLSDAEKLAELRHPTSTRASKSKSASQDELVALVGNEVVKLRRLARGFAEASHRAALVEDWVGAFRSRAARAGWPIRLVDTLCAVVKAETTGWKHWGTLTVYPAEQPKSAMKRGKR